ncbi:hypothetical protein PMKS-000152 [Pichia membranifaciens]|uniref:Uncharacterized protein n=1 Tax=Pichia membranifaciens TaxID=4926 RepID=A0A1Q2YAZ0_9ASCO|nr:hypothetical protein PMKS-000152 [Pichia membranifaciens]
MGSQGRGINLDELVQLEFQDATLHKQVVETLDGIIYRSIYSKVEDEFFATEDVDDALLDEAIQNEMSDMKDFDPAFLSSTGESELDKLEKYLKNMVKVRNQIVEQQIITDAYDADEVDGDLLEEKNRIAKSKLANVESLPDNLPKLKDVRTENLAKLEKVQQLVGKQRELRRQVRPVDGIEEHITEEELEEIKMRYKKIIGKNLMLGHFITDLIAALNSSNVATDERLLEILMDCGDYSDYELLYD